MPPDPRSQEARLSVDLKGGWSIAPGGAFRWVVHRGTPIVAQLVSSLAGLGSGESAIATIRVAAGSDVVTTTQGPALLLRTHSPARYTTEIDVGRDGHVTHLPWVAIPFPGARAELTTVVRVASGGCFVGWELVASGRPARNERFEQDRLAMRTRIEYDGRPLLDERALLLEQDQAWASHLLQHTHLGSLFVVAYSARLPSTEDVRCLVEGEAVYAAATRPAPELLLVRSLASGSEPLERAFWPVVRTIRESLGMAETHAGRIARRWM